MKYVLLMILMLTAVRSYASGCGWETKYEKGARLSSGPATGKFSCYTVGSSYVCRFNSDESPSRQFLKYWIDAVQVPPQGVLLTVMVETFEGMSWEDCDGGDPVPEFKRNGVYEQVTFNGAEYYRFTRDPVPRLAAAPRDCSSEIEQYAIELLHLEGFGNIAQCTFYQGECLHPISSETQANGATRYTVTYQYGGAYPNFTVLFITAGSNCQIENVNYMRH